MDENNIKWFRELDSNHTTEIGYKAARLVELFKARFPIPRGFVINSKYYYSFLQQNNIKEKINEIIKSIDFNNKNEIIKKSNEIRKLFFKTKINDDFKIELAKIYSKIGETSVGWLNSVVNTFVVIRVSLTSEEYTPAQLDFVEQLGGALNIKGVDSLIANIKESWASLYLPEALEYYHKNNINHNKVGISLIVQKMINATRSGISIISKDKNTVIESILGYGGKSVIKELTPDHYEVSNQLQVRNKKISTQEWMLKRMVGKTTKVKVDKQHRDIQKLQTSDIKELSDLSKKLYLYFSVPLTIDWAIEHADFYILSADPLDPTLKKNKKTKKNNGIQDKMDSFKKEIIIKGIPVSEGIANGVVKIVKNRKDLEEVTENTILVTKIVYLEMNNYIKKAKAIVTDAGSSISHAALFAKKYEIPCIVHTDRATTVLKNGQKIQVNGNNGVVYKLTGVKIANIPKEQNNIKEKDLIIRKEETEYPETITKTIVNLDSFESLSKININEVDGFVIDLKTLFSDSELTDLLEYKDLIINHIKVKLKKLLKVIKNKKIYYKINLHENNLIDINISDLEIEAIIDSTEFEEIVISLENIKSISELQKIRTIINNKNKIAVTVDNSNENMINEIINEHIKNIILNINENEINNIESIIKKLKDNKINRIINIKEDFNNETIKKIVDLKINEVVVDYNNIQVKEIIYKKEQELLRNLLSI